MSDPIPLHPDLRPLSFLLGSWRGKGHGCYPTIADFDYLEMVTFSHVGKPFMAYAQRTSDATTGMALHAEAGYLRPTGRRTAEFVVAQPSGIVELHDVAIDGETLLLTSHTVVTTPTAKTVEAVIRAITVVGDRLDYHLDMSAVGEEMQRHLTGSLER